MNDYIRCKICKELIWKPESNMVSHRVNGKQFWAHKFCVSLLMPGITIL